MSIAFPKKSPALRRPVPSLECRPVPHSRSQLERTRSGSSSSWRSHTAGSPRHIEIRQTSFVSAPIRHRMSGCTGSPRGCRPRTSVQAPVVRPHHSPSRERSSPCTSPHSNLRRKPSVWVAELALPSQVGRPREGAAKRRGVFQERNLQTPFSSFSSDRTDLAAVSARRARHTRLSPSVRPRTPGTAQASGREPPKQQLTTALAGSSVSVWCQLGARSVGRRLRPRCVATSPGYSVQRVSAAARGGSSTLSRWARELAEHVAPPSNRDHHLGSPRIRLDLLPQAFDTALHLVWSAP